MNKTLPMTNDEVSLNNLFGNYKLIKTKYRFRSKKQKEDYFNNLSKINPYKFRRELYEWHEEKLEVYDSWRRLFFLISGIMLIIGIYISIFNAQIAAIVVVSIALLMFGLSLYVRKKQTSFQLSYDLIRSFFDNPKYFSYFCNTKDSKDSQDYS